MGVFSKEGVLEHRGQRSPPSRLLPPPVAIGETMTTTRHANAGTSAAMPRTKITYPPFPSPSANAASARADARKFTRGDGKAQDAVLFRTYSLCVRSCFSSRDR